EALMAAVRGCDIDELESLRERSREPLCDFFSGLRGDRVIGGGLVQEVFVRILKYRSTYQESSRFVTWMYQIGRNARADYLRKHKIIPLEEHPFTSPEDDITPSRQLEAREEMALLQCALMQTSDSNRELLILARYQEMKYEDIADLLGLPLGAVKTRVYRATKELREAFLKLRSNTSSCSAAKSKTTLPTT